MTLREYQIEAHKTAIYPQDKAREYLSLGLLSEIGELCGVRKKFLRGDFGEEEYKRRIMSEIGDVMWYIVEISTYHEILFDIEIKGNIHCCSVLSVINGVFDLLSGSKPSLGDVYFVINRVIGLSCLDVSEFYTALEQNIAKLKQRQEKGTLKGDGEGVR